MASRHKSTESNGIRVKFMQTSLAQCVSFILHGNQFLQENSDFEFHSLKLLQNCESIEFCEWDKMRAQAKLPLIASDLKEWFEKKFPAEYERMMFTFTHNANSNL